MYQDVYFANAQDQGVYEKKVYLRKIMLLLAYSKEDQEAIVKSSVYDVQDILQSKDYTHLIEVLGELKDNERVLKSLGVDYEEMFKIDEALPKDILDSIQSSIGDVSSLFGSDVFSNITVDNSIEKVKKFGKGLVEDVKTVSDLLK